MNDFQFQNTTKVYFGQNQLQHLHEEVFKYGNKVLVAHGGDFIKNSPLYKNVIQELKMNGIEVFELGAVEPNPRHTTVNKGAKICKEHGIQTTLAIGGGSTIDCCKAIAATTLADTEDIWDLVEKKVSWHDALAVIAIPTIASTGSEMDKSCVIANVDIGVKSGINGENLRPKAAFLDPTNTFTVPARQTACGGFDIMAHLFDMNYFVNAPKYPLQFNVVESLLKTIKTTLPIAIQEPQNYEARATLLWGASWALNSFCTSGFKTQPSLHALEQFSSTYDLTHGLGLAIVMPKWMKYLLDRDESVIDDFVRFGINVMGIEVSDDKKQMAYQTIEALQSYIRDELNLPVHLSELGIDDRHFDTMKVKACYGQKELSNGYRPLTQEDCLNIYKMCL